jgi:hypothetical protein
VELKKKTKKPQATHLNPLQNASIYALTLAKGHIWLYISVNAFSPASGSCAGWFPNRRHKAKNELVDGISAIQKEKVFFFEESQTEIS